MVVTQKSSPTVLLSTSACPPVTRDSIQVYGHGQPSLAFEAGCRVAAALSSPPPQPAHAGQPDRCPPGAPGPATAQAWPTPFLPPGGEGAVIQAIGLALIREPSERGRDKNIIAKQAVLWASAVGGRGQQPG